MGNTAIGGGESQERLLQALAEQLKTPLLHIARRAELSRADGEDQVLARIEETAGLALKLVDGYLLAARSGQTSLSLEPVSLSAILQDTAQQLGPIARQYNCELEVSLAGKYGPVMAHQEGLQAALLSMGHVFIEAGKQTAGRRPVVTLAAHKNSHGMTAGIYSDVDGLSADVFRRAKVLYGRARQPLHAFSASSGAGVFVADSLFGAMDTRLRVESYKKTAGLAATLIPSRQLSLV